MADKFRMNPICIRVNDNTRMRLEEISKKNNFPLSVTTRALLDMTLNTLFDNDGFVQSQGAKGFGR